MIVKRMVLEGNYVEAFLYFDYLWLFDNEGGVRAFDLELFIDAELNGSGNAARKLFARNDELVRPDGWVTASAQIGAVQRFIGGEQVVAVSARNVDEYSIHVDAGSALRRPLDVRMYNGHVFVSVPGGLAQFEAFGREDVPPSSLGSAHRSLASRAERVFDEGTPLQIQCRLGALSLACGGEGLFAGTGASDQGRWTPKLDAIAEVSFGCEVSRAGISSIADEADLELRPVTTAASIAPFRRSRGDEAAEPITIVRIGPDVDENAGRRFRTTLAQMRSRGVQPAQTFLSTTSAFTLMSSGRMVRTSLTHDNAFSPADWDGTLQDAPEGDVIGMTTTAGKMLAETHEDVQILHRGRWLTLFEEPVLRVRGYPNSKWYRQLVTIVAEGRTELVFICDD